MSRTDMPKQFLDMFGTGRSLLQQTYDRIRPLCDPENILLTTNVHYVDIIREQLPEIPAANILAEPARRNTAPCICRAAHHIYARNPEASIINIPSDHLVLKENAFIEVLSQGIDFVEKGDRLLTIGLKPVSPHTGYGYIQLGATLDDPSGIRKVKSFTEKPDIEMARTFLANGEFYWNSGMFLWRADSIIKAFEQYAPEINALFSKACDLIGTPSEAEYINTIYPSAPNISVDYAVMEKARNVYVKTADIGWSDLENWKVLYEISPKTMDGNVTQNCRVLASNSHGNIFAASGDKIMVVSGLDGFIVADTDQALMICPVNDEKRIRQVLNEVKEHFGEKFI